MGRARISWSEYKPECSRRDHVTKFGLSVEITSSSKLLAAQQQEIESNENIGIEIMKIMKRYMSAPA